MRIQSQIYLGWTPILGVATDGARKVLQVTGWEGGSGIAPATGVYVGESGYVTNISDGANIQGADGAAGSSYTHIQAIPNDTWTISHNLGFNPSITVIDSANDKVEGDLLYIDLNTVQLSFNGAFSGTAYLS